LSYEGRVYAIKLSFNISRCDENFNIVELLVNGKMQKPESVVEKPPRK
jgi:hypothetical protein